MGEIHDVTWFGFPRPRWRLSCQWGCAATEYPALHARLYFDSWSGESRFVVVHLDGYYWSCKAAHRSKWQLTLEQEHAIVATYIRKAVQQTEKKLEKVAAEAAGWAAAHAALWEYMTVDSFEDGAPRERSMLLVFVEDGRFKVALQDRQEGRSLWAGADSISEALRALESALKSGNGDWRQMKGAYQKGKKRS